MTDLARYVASNPLDVLPLPCIEFSHPSWPAPHRRVMQPFACVVDIDGVPTMFPGWHDVGPWLSTFPASDDSGRATRKVSLDDANKVLRRLILPVVEGPIRTRVRIWTFTTEDVTTPKIAERYQVQGIHPNGAQLDVDCVTPDYSLFNDPHILGTEDSYPALRGR